MLLKKGLIPQPLFDTDVSMGLGRSLAAAVKTGLTDQLSRHFQSAGELAGKAGLDETIVGLVLDCLVSLGYVNKKENTYAFTKIGERFLDKKSPFNLLHYILFSERIHYHSFLPLDEILQSGRKPKDNLNEFTDEDWKLFTLAMLDVARLNIDEVTKAIPTPAGNSKLLDLGGSHGLYSIYQCKKNPSLKAEIFDLEAVRPYLQENVEKYNMQDQVSLVVGDFMEQEWKKDYDMIFAFNIVHGLNNEDNQKLFTKAFSSLKQKGSFVIFDQVKGMTSRSQLSKAIPSYMGLNLYIQTGGRTYSVDELSNSLKDTGFSSVQIKKLKTPGIGLVIARKG